MKNPRLGTKNEQGEITSRPTQTISGLPVPPRPYSTIGISDGYFAVLDSHIDPKRRNELVLELQKLIAPAKPAPKTSAKESAES